MHSKINDEFIERIIPAELFNKIQKVRNAKSVKKKNGVHRAVWDYLTLNSNVLVPILVEFVEHQCKQVFGIDHIVSFAPILVSSEDIDCIEFMFNKTKMICRNSANDECQKKKIVMHLNVHSEFLTESNIKQLIAMIERTDPDVITLKFMTGDIKKRESLRNDYNLLILKLAKSHLRLKFLLFISMPTTKDSFLI